MDALVGVDNLAGELDGVCDEGAMPTVGTDVGADADADADVGWSVGGVAAFGSMASNRTSTALASSSNVFSWNMSASKLRPSTLAFVPLVLIRLIHHVPNMSEATKPRRQTRSATLTCTAP